MKPGTSEVVDLPQHVLDNRFLQGLVERLLHPEYFPPEDEEEATTEKVGCDFEDAVAHRWCDCDPDERGEEGFGEDAEKEDGWFCSFRNIEYDYQMHVVLDRAQSAIDPNRGDFPESIYKEICERYNVEQTKTQGQMQDSSDQEQTSPPHSPPRPCVSPPFFLQRLPPEVLVEIVLFAQAVDPHAHITLSHVDAYLRTFVNSTPLLWAHVDFLYPLHLVHLYFEHSADVPLRVTMLPPLQNASNDSPLLNDVTANEDKRVKQFMRALYPHRHRVLSLRLRCHDFNFEVSAENEEQIPAPEFLWDGSMVKLELLDLELSNWLWEGKIPSSSTIRDLRLHGPWTAFSLPLFSSRLKSLTLTDDDTSFTKVFCALLAAPCLVSLTLRDMSLAGAREGGGSLLTFDQLESLSLIRVVPPAMHGLFSCITAPNLVSIALQSTNPPIVLNYNRLPLFPTPQPSVQRLSLSDFEGGPFIFASFLRNFPCITHLRIASSIIFEQHLLPLAVKPSPLGEPDITETACPKLKHLTIDNEFNPLTGVIGLIAFSRHSAGIPLESVTLRGFPMDDAAYNDIRRLGDIIPKLDIGEFDQELDVYGDSDAFSASETSSEGDWASGDEEIVIARQKYGEPYTFEGFVGHTFDGDWETEE